MTKTFCCKDMETVIRKGNTLVGDVFRETKGRSEDKYIAIVFKKEGLLRAFVKYCPFCGIQLCRQKEINEIKADSTTSNGDEEIIITQ